MDLVQLKKIWHREKFYPRKRLGQNFLIDKNVRDKILNVFSLGKDSIVVEIGAGFGVMSLPLAARCGKLFAIEKDARICGIMKEEIKGIKNFELVHGDILKLDLCKLTGEKRGIIVYGNVPYYITTPLISKMIEQRKCIDTVYMVIQEELADRIISAPGSKRYGAISCFVQFYTEAVKVFRIKRNSFYPRPEVESCLLKLGMLSSPRIKVKDEKLMFQIIRKAFSQRRKKMVNPLSSRNFLDIDKHKWEQILKKCGINVSSRAEDLSLEDYARLSDFVGGVIVKKKK